MDVNGPRWQEVLWSEEISPLLEGQLAGDELGALTCRSARTHRELVKRRALGRKLAPLGYYLRDDELGEHTNIDRCPSGGIDIGPAC